MPGKEGEIARTVPLEQAREDGIWCLRRALAGHRRGLLNCFNFLTEARARPSAEGRARGGNLTLRPCTRHFGWFSQGCTKRNVRPPHPRLHGHSAHPPTPTDTLQQLICAAGVTAPSCQGHCSHPSSWAAAELRKAAHSSRFDLDPC